MSEWRDEAVRLRNGGMSFGKIAQWVNVPKETVRRALIEVDGPDGVERWNLERVNDLRAVMRCMKRGLGLEETATEAGISIERAHLLRFEIKRAKRSGA